VIGLALKRLYIKCAVPFTLPLHSSTGRVIQTRPPMSYFCIDVDRAPAPYMHIKFQVSSFNRSGDTRAFQNLNGGPQTPCALLLHSLRWGPSPSTCKQSFKSLASALLEIQSVPKFKSSSFFLVCGGSPVTQCPVDLQERSPQTASWSVQPFLHSKAEVSRVTNKQTDRHRAHR